jgi:CheY-like chemotaxis protein
MIQLALTTSPTEGAPPMLRVLVVDASPDAVMSLQLLLQSWGYEACVAVDGPTALELGDSFRPDIVILDIALPGMDGYELAKRLRKPNSETPLILAHSGYCSDADMCRSLKAGFVAHLAKPADPEDVRKILVILEKWPHWNPPAPREDGSRPTISLAETPTRATSASSQTSSSGGQHPPVGIEDDKDSVLFP